jgi:probable phosphoglycerate mutase
MLPMTQPVYLVRHGQSEWNVLRLTQGQTHAPRLTALGRLQAASAAELVAGDLPSDRVPRLLTSDLLRASETAAVVGFRLGVRPCGDVRLREQHLGSLQGRGYDETWAAAEAHDWSNPTLPVAGGESLQEVHDRMAGVLADLRPSEVTVLVSHGDAIRAAVACLLGQRPNEAEWVEVANGSVARWDGVSLRWLG